MHWLLIITLITPQGLVPYSQSFDFQYQCLTRMQSLQTQYPGSAGSCTHD